MRRARVSTETPTAGEAGSASLEFLVVAVILLVPIVYLIVALGTIQQQALGVETGARQLARTVATAPDAAVARDRSSRVIDEIVAEYGIDPTALAVSATCDPGAPSCPEPGALVRVTLRTSVALPLVPPVLGLDRATRVSVEASAVHRVSRFWTGTP